MFTRRNIFATIAGAVAAMVGFDAKVPSGQYVYVADDPELEFRVIY